MTKCECDAIIVSSQLKSFSSRVIEVCILDKSECKRECNGERSCCSDATDRMRDLRVIIGSRRNKSEKCLFIELKLCVKGKVKKTDRIRMLKLLNGIARKMENARSCRENLPTKYYAVFSEDLRSLKLLIDLHEQFSARYPFRLVFGLEELKKEIVKGDC